MKQAETPLSMSMKEFPLVYAPAVPTHTRCGLGEGMERIWCSSFKGIGGDCAMEWIVSVGLPRLISPMRHDSDTCDADTVAWLRGVALQEGGGGGGGRQGTGKCVL